MNRASQPVVAPIPPSQRVQIIDTLRGFAIFGILLVNMALFNFGPVEWLWRSLTYGERQPMRYPPGDTSGRNRPAPVGGKP
jgi:uncharacterized membrane protein YeiB